MLELRQLDCVRGGRTVFRGVSGRVCAGQLLRVRGANGSGKSSLLRMVCGLLAPAAGEVLWDGQSVVTLREEFGRQLLYVGHGAAVKDDLSAQENLRAASELAGRPCGLQQAMQALAESGLSGRERVPVRLLSQGQKRRVALARLALGDSQPLWVLDEPLNALDTAASEWVMGRVHTHVAQGGVVVLTSHQDTPLDAYGAQVAVAL